VSRPVGPRIEPPDAGTDRGGRPTRVGRRARTSDARAHVEAVLWALGGVEISAAAAAEPDVLVYAAHCPHDFVALLGPDFEPSRRSVVMDLAGAIDPRVAALLGALAYLQPDCPPDHLRYCLQEVARGFPYAQEPYGGVFHYTRERTLLTIEQKQILSLEAQGYTRQPPTSGALQTLPGPGVTLVEGVGQPKGTEL
jgi:hypothetical protein